MKPCLSQVCSLGGPLEQDLADYAAGKCQAIEIWLTKLETYLQSHSIQAFLDLLDRHAMSVPVASYQGGLLSEPGPATRRGLGTVGPPTAAVPAGRHSDLGGCCRHCRHR